MSTLRESDFREASKELANNESMLSLFNSYGINVETLRLLLVGLDENSNIIMPIMTHRNKIVGTLTITDIERNGGIYQYSCDGFVGAPYSDRGSITIVKNVIDLMLVWQLGIDSVAVMTDREQMPYLRFYKEINLIDGEDDLIELTHQPLYSYGIKDLPVYLQMHKNLPDKTTLENKQRRTASINLPAIIDNKVFVMYKINGFVMDSDGTIYRSFRISDGVRRFKYQETDIFFKGSAWSTITKGRTKTKPKVNLNEIYTEVFEYVYTNIFCISEDQAKLISMFVMYMWGFYFKHPLKMHLHIINPSLIQSSLIYKVLQKICPNDKGLMHAPKVYMRQEKDINAFYNHPYIYVDQCLTYGNYDIGPKILIDEDSMDLRKTVVKKVPLNRHLKLREKLSTLLFHYKGKMEEDYDEGLYPYYMPFYQVGLKLGMTQREVKDLFYLVCGFSQRKFKKIDIKEYIVKHATKFSEDPKNPG